MNLRIRVIVLAALVGLAFGVATASETNPLATPPQARPFIPSPVIFPDQVIPLRFFHDKHLAQDIDCTSCHENAEDSVSASDNLVPHGMGEAGMEICLTCHDLEEPAGDPKDETVPPAACTTCHGQAYKPEFPEGVEPFDYARVKNHPAEMEIPNPNLKMNHKIHAAKGIECTVCHGKMTDIQVATRENALPLMNTCLTCHNGSKASAECRTCHLARPDGLLVTTFGSGVLKPSGQFRNDAHDDNYLKSHAQTAKGDEAYCGQCHEDRFCLQCHNGVSRPLTIHPNNWIITHPLSARRNNPTCSSCHRTQTFCLDCHKRMKVVTPTEFDAGKTGQAFDRVRFGSFHPAGWVGDVKTGSIRGKSHHSFQAQRNMRTCAACHTERTCLGCHKSGTLNGVGINPHGLGFKNSRKCRALKQRNARVCTKCHQTAPDCK